MSKEPDYDQIIEVTNLTKQFKSRWAVDGLSFSVKPGQTLGLLGPNGAGKSTTMRILMGLSRPTAGQVQVFGYDLPRQAKQVHNLIGVVFERPNLFENLSGYDNLAIFCGLYRQPLTLIKPLLEQMDLWERAHDPVKVYSKGMRQRILILRALIHQPRLLILDEPCSGLDPVTSRTIRNYLLAQKAKGITIILTSHDMEEVDELCDVIGFINHGKMIALAPTQSLKQKYGRPLLKIRYAEEQSIKEELLTPEANNLLKIEQLYRENKIIAIRSMEASLAEIFTKLSSSEEA